MQNKKLAKDIVEHVLLWVEKVGTLSGRKHNKRVLFSGSLVDLKTGDVQNVMDRIVDDVDAMIGRKTGGSDAEA